MRLRVLNRAFLACAVAVLAACGGGGSSAPAPVVTAPTITTQPTNQAAMVGGTATFTVVASGTGLTYQWNKGGTAISGATSASYTTPALTLGDNGSTFTVTVSNSGGSITSSPAATLTVTASATAPTITTQPANQTATVGAPATFTVVAAGTAPLTYQWNKGGAAIAGATAASYTTPTLALADSGSMYTVTVTNSAGSITSSPAATLTVNPPAPTITTQPTNQAAAIGASATFTVVANGSGAALSYQWMRDGTNIASATNASYTTPALDATYIYAVQTGASYSVKVTSAGGTVTSAPAMVSVTHSLTVLAGGLGGLGHTNGTGSAASFYNPSGVGTDPSGNVYVADQNNNVIRKITPAGVVTTLAGTAGVTGSNDGTGANAQFNAPTGVASDSTGTNLYVADSHNDTIRQIVIATGVVTTVAGSPGVGASDNGTGSAAHFDSPSAVAVDSAGNIFVADTNNDEIRMIAPGAVVTTLAGSPGVAGSADGTGAAASFSLPHGIAIDSATGNLYVADYLNSTIRKVTSAGAVTTLAGTAGTFGAVDGTGPAAQFNGPLGVALDSTATNVYVADAGNTTVRQVTTAGGAVTTLAGGTGGYSNGTGGAAQFAYPSSVATDSSGNVFVADADNNLIRKVTTPGAAVTTLAGNIGGRGYFNSGWILAKFNDPHNVAIDAANDVFVADLGNNVIREIAGGGTIVSTFAGSVGPGGVGSADGTGAAAQFHGPYDMVTDSQGNLFVADGTNNTIRKITPAGVVSTFAGTAGVTGHANGTGAAASFNSPYGLAIDAADTLYVADYGNQLIRKITSAGLVTTLAGYPLYIGSDDGTGNFAHFHGPHGVAVDRTTGNVYVADRFNHDIRMITPAGVVTTIAGSPGVAGFADGTGNTARFNWPGALSVDPATGNLYVTDYNNNAVRKLTSITPTSALVTTVVGYAPGASPAPVGVVLGSLPAALSGPTSIVVVPAVPAQNLPVQLVIADDAENAVLLATLP